MVDRATSQPDNTLATALGLDEGGRAVAFGAPKSVILRLQAERPASSIESKPLAGVYTSRPSSFLLGFCSLKSELTRALPALHRLLETEGVLWVGWPKQSVWDLEGIRAEMGITAETVRECAAPLGLVDESTRELDDTWSALKLVRRAA